MQLIFLCLCRRAGTGASGMQLYIGGHNSTGKSRESNREGALLGQPFFFFHEQARQQRTFENAQPREGRGPVGGVSRIGLVLPMGLGTGPIPLVCAGFLGCAGVIRRNFVAHLLKGALSLFCCALFPPPQPHKNPLFINEPRRARPSQSPPQKTINGGGGGGEAHRKERPPTGTSKTGPREITPPLLCTYK
jgi:hypothetical protein